MSENIINSAYAKPNYFDIFKRVLNELNYREIESFENIDRSEHKRILNLINSTNNEILSSYIFDFQIKSHKMTLKANETKLLTGFNGRIISVYEGNNQYKYVHPALISPSSKNKTNFYSSVGDLIITTASNTDRELDILYVSNCYALDSSGSEKAKMELETDTSILPLPYLEPLLVYGTLLKAKANPSFVKYGYWRSCYYSALVNLRSQGSKSTEDYPKINIDTY